MIELEIGDCMCRYSMFGPGLLTSRVIKVSVWGICVGASACEF